MALKKKKLNPWVNHQVRFFEPKSDDYGFIKNSDGLFLGGYPFKITEISCDAPIITSPEQNLSFENFQEFDLTLSIQNGNIYDLSRYENDINTPLYVTKKSDGRFLFIQPEGKEFLNETDMEDLKVEMEIPDQITIKVKTRELNTDVSEGYGMIFCVVEFEDTTALTDGKSSKIERASIVNLEQLNEKFPGTVIFSGTVILPLESQKTARAFVFYSAENSRYVCLNSANSFLGRTFAMSSPERIASYSEEFKEKIRTDLGGGKFYFVFQSNPPNNVLRNHLFLRIH